MPLIMQLTVSVHHMLLKFDHHSWLQDQLITVTQRN